MRISALFALMALTLAVPATAASLSPTQDPSWKHDSFNEQLRTAADRMSSLPFGIKIESRGGYVSVFNRQLDPESDLSFGFQTGDQRSSDATMRATDHYGHAHQGTVPMLRLRLW